MEVKQIYQITNLMHDEVTGLSVVMEEDLSNVVEYGQDILNTGNVDNYVRKLPDVIGRVIFVDRLYVGAMPSMVRDSWEYGSILEKVSMNPPEAVQNDSWDLESGTSYDPNIFTAPSIRARFWDKQVTFEIDMSITEDQIKSAFSSAAQLNGFLSMIATGIQNRFTVDTDSLALSAIRNMIGETIWDEYESSGSLGSLSGSSGVRAVNLLYLYNNGPNAGGTALTAAKALTNADFIKFASMTMANYINRLKYMSTLFNLDGAERFTPAARLHAILLADFKNAAGAYLQSTTFHNEYTALPNADAVPYWQGSGVGYALADTAAIDVVTSEGHDVAASYILGVMFDQDAMGISNLDRRTTTQYNAKAEFWNQFHKLLCGVWNDPAENFVVFFAA